MIVNLYFFSLTRSTLLSLPSNPLEESNTDTATISVENWTKWRIYVRQKPEDTPKVIYARTGENISFLNQVRTKLLFTGIQCIFLKKKIHFGNFPTSAKFCAF